jgi:hypothetical protein
MQPSLLQLIAGRPLVDLLWPFAKEHKLEALQFLH